MGEIIDTEEVDRDTVSADILEQQFCEKYTLLAETEVSSKNSYINRLHGTKSLKLAVCQSDNSIEVYELNKTSLSRVCRLSGHGKSLTEVVFSPKEDYLLYSCGHDGLIKLWDTRTKGSCVQEYKGDDDSGLTKAFECLDISCNGRVLCAGSALLQDDAYLVFWDQRSPAPLGGYWNSHTDDISQVKFHPSKPEFLASGALDGLMNVYNILESNEDDALTYSLNVENSVEKISWLQGMQLSCVSQSSDLQVWDAGGGDPLHSYGRHKVARSIRRSAGDDCYLVDVFVCADGRAALLAGSHGGDGHALRSVSLVDKKLQPRSMFAPNKQTVRCCYYNIERDLLVTAGEGGLIDVWARRGEREGQVEREGGARVQLNGDNKLAHKMNKLHVQRHKPY